MPKPVITPLNFTDLFNTFTMNILQHKPVPMEFYIHDISYMWEKEPGDRMSCEFDDYIEDLNIYWNQDNDDTFHGAVIYGILILHGEAGTSFDRDRLRKTAREIKKLIRQRIKEN